MLFERNLRFDLLLSRTWISLVRFPKPASAAIQTAVLRVIAAADGVSAVVEAAIDYPTYAAADSKDQGAGMELKFAVEDDSESAAAADVVRDFSGADGEAVVHSELE